MPISNEPVTVRQFMEMIQDLDESDMDLPLKVNESHGAYGIYSLRRMEIKETDVSHEEAGKPVKDKYIVING